MLLLEQLMLVSLSLQYGKHHYQEQTRKLKKLDYYDLKNYFSALHRIKAIPYSSRLIFPTVLIYFPSLWYSLLKY